jgi:hypothetical protein
MQLVLPATAAIRSSLITAGVRPRKWTVLDAKLQSQWPARLRSVKRGSHACMQRSLQAACCCEHCRKALKDKQSQAKATLRLCSVGGGKQVKRSCPEKQHHMEHSSAPCSLDDLMEDSRDDIQENRKKGVLNENLERIRLDALKHADAEEAALKARRPRSIPPMVMPRDRGTVYDIYAIKESLHIPVVLENLSVAELVRGIPLLASALKVGRKPDQSKESWERIKQCLIPYMALIRKSSESSFWTVMIKNGLPRLMFGSRRLAGIIPEEDSWKLLQTASDFVVNENLRSEVRGLS